VTLTKLTVYQEATTVVNIYVLNAGTPYFIKSTDGVQKIIMQDLNIPLSLISRSPRQKLNNNKKPSELNDTYRANV
jgi:hypothetical protein